MPYDKYARSLLRTRTEVFLMIARTRSFTETARQLGMSQSSVSRAVAELERELGVALIEHHVRPVRLTPRGALLRQVMNDECERLRARLSVLSEAAAGSGPLRVGIVESLARVVGRRLVEAFDGACSTVTVLTGIARYLLQLLDANELDVIICSDPFNARADLKRRFLFREPSIVLMPAGAMAHEAAVARLDRAHPLTWERLQHCGLPIIRYHRNNSGGRLEEKLFDDLGLSFESTLEVDINALLLTFVAEGRGWTITRPTTLVQHPELAQGVRALPMPEPVVSRELFVITRAAEESPLAARIAAVAARSVAEDLIPAFARYAPWVNDYVFYADADNLDAPGHVAAGAGLPSRVFVL